MEPIFDGIIPLARELPVGSNYLDLLFVNAQGYLTLVETKLWRNPEARRAVISQIIEYASGMSTWSYEDFMSAVQKANPKMNAEAIHDLARRSDQSFEQARFIDTLQLNLKLGRFLLLIVGDGIQEGVEGLANFLNRTPQLGFRLALLEMALFRLEEGKDDPLFVQPRIVARTREVTRAVVELRSSAASPQPAVSVPQEDAASSDSKLTEIQFLERVAATQGQEASAAVKWLLEQMPRHQLRPKWGKQSLSIYYYDEESGYEFSLGHLAENGDVPLYTLHDQCKRLALPDDIWRGYFQAVASLVPGAKVETGTSKSGAPWAQVFVGDHEQHPQLRELRKHKEAWVAAMDAAAERIKHAMRAREPAAHANPQDCR